VRDFIGTVAEGGCNVFIVHARNAWLKGLSPKENREIPPLRYDVVAQLKRDFPQLTIAINGGIATDAVVQEQLQHVDGVMVGREAYHNPWWLSRWDELYFGAAPSTLSHVEVEEAMVRYMEQEAAKHGTGWYSIARHMLGLRHGMPGARRWRQVWSDHRLKQLSAREVFAIANTKP
jgi:tRNA-dihydrouridine synthase A